MASNNNLNNDPLVYLHPAKSLVDAIDYILLFGHILESSNINNDKQQLINLELDIKENPSKLHDLIRTSADHYKIDLQIIAYTNEKLEIINKYWPFDRNKLKKQAFLIFHSDYTICGPLFAHDQNGIQTVFAIDDMRIQHYVDAYIEKTNQNPSIDFDVTEEQPSSFAQESSNDMMVDEISTSTNDSNSENPVQPTNTSSRHAVCDQIIQRIFQLYRTLSPTLDKIPIEIQTSESNIDNFNYTSSKKVAQTLLEQVQNFSRVIQSALEHIPDNDKIDKSSTVADDTRTVQSTADGLNDIAPSMQNIQHSSNISLLPLNHLSTTTQVTPIIQVPALPQFSYAEPEIIIQPKEEWHRRYMRDVGKRKMPLLSGDGPQRTLIRVKVPAVSGCRMYLCITPFTFSGQGHPLKVTVPAKTKIDKDLLSHDNNFRCLLFTDCDSTDHFDSVKRHVYLEIIAAEHEAQYKDVKIYMFNLYQNSSITKRIIKARQLNLCKLGFCLCVVMGEQFQPVSSWSFSRIIRDEKRIGSQHCTPVESEN